MKLEDDSYCSMCGEEQTAKRLRLTKLGKPVRNASKSRNIRFGKILKFALSAGLWNTGN